MAEGFNFEAAKLKAVPLPKSDRKALPFCIEEVDGLDWLNESLSRKLASLVIAEEYICVSDDSDEPEFCAPGALREYSPNPSQPSTPNSENSLGNSALSASHSSDSESMAVYSSASEMKDRSPERPDERERSVDPKEDEVPLPESTPVEEGSLADDEGGTTEDAGSLSDREAPPSFTIGKMAIPLTIADAATFAPVLLRDRPTATAESVNSHKISIRYRPVRNRTDVLTVWTLSESNGPSPHALVLFNILPGHLHIHHDLSCNTLHAFLLSTADEWTDISHDYWDKNFDTRKISHPRVRQLFLATTKQMFPQWVTETTLHRHQRAMAPAPPAIERPRRFKGEDKGKSKQ